MSELTGLQVYKFGGASVKDAAAILNLRRIVREYGSNASLLIVVSAMGKTTNALEEIFQLAYAGQDYARPLAGLEMFHREVAAELLDPSEVEMALNEYLGDLRQSLAELIPGNFDQQYDQIVSYGELLSSRIVAAAIDGNWQDCRELIQTDTTWREGKVDWVGTEAAIWNMLRHKGGPPMHQVPVVTQGFIGRAPDGLTTTLGREGSDYTAAIFAYCLRAESVTIWKDVAGLLNADPKIFPDTVRYPEISYRETIEMAYYGASVIHPKTLKPLAERNIPLRVKSFLDPEAEGTLIHDCRHAALAPAIIRKTDQCLLSFASKDFAFISEENLEVIFGALAQAKLKINVMQNSAISFSVCTDFSERRISQLLDLLREQFTLHYNTGLTLFTIKNYDAASVARLTAGRELLLEQRTRGTFQFVCK
ncbi:aspartate kinase [Hymenobacter terricola]|uniref:aspartate kinase n=1 Tax=Hymenobacter terricola TaxID=2819236 RepID=UPI001B31584D|nr:aspartate kinase [Hymenobacter terricola]